MSTYSENVLRRKGFTLGIKKAVMKRDGGICRYCGDTADTVDHIIPVTYIPIHTMANLVASCSLCNGKAGNKVFMDLDNKRQFILENTAANRKIIPIWTIWELSELGKGLQSKIKAEALVVQTDKEADHVAYYLEQMGLTPKIYR